MFTKQIHLVHQTDPPSHLCVLQIPNLPAWSLHKPTIDLYVLAFIRTGSRLIVPLNLTHMSTTANIGYLH